MLLINSDGVKDTSLKANAKDSSIYAKATRGQGLHLHGNGEQD